MENVTRKNRHEGEVRSPEETCSRRDRKQRRNAWTFLDVAKAVNQILPKRAAILHRMRNCFLLLKPNETQRYHNGDERNSIGVKAAGQPKEFESKCCSHRAYHARQLKLCGVERNSVSKIFSSYKIVSHRL